MLCITIYELEKVNVNKEFHVFNWPKIELWQRTLRGYVAKDAFNINYSKRLRLFQLGILPYEITIGANRNSGANQIGHAPVLNFLLLMCILKQMCRPFPLCF